MSAYLVPSNQLDAKIDWLNKTFQEIIDKQYQLQDEQYAQSLAEAQQKWQAAKDKQRVDNVETQQNYKFDELLHEMERARESDINDNDFNAEYNFLPNIPAWPQLPSQQLFEIHTDGLYSASTSLFSETKKVQELPDKMYRLPNVMMPVTQTMKTVRVPQMSPPEYAVSQMPEQAKIGAANYLSAEIQNSEQKVLSANFSKKEQPPLPPSPQVPLPPSSPYNNIDKGFIRTPPANAPEVCPPPFLKDRYTLSI